MWQMCVHLQPWGKNAEFYGLCAEATAQFNKMSRKSHGGSWMTKQGQSQQTPMGLYGRGSSALPILVLGTVTARGHWLFD